MPYILASIGAVILVFLAVVIIRTLQFKPKAMPEADGETIEFDRERALDDLARLVRCKTISRIDHVGEDDAEFDKLVGILPELYPNVYQKCEFKSFPDRGLLYKWEGKNHASPSVYMAHYDVVPVNEEGWEKPPFDGIIEDGVLWGRGTLDTKMTFSGALFAANHLIGEGFVPENDIYLAFSGCEEVNGLGAKHIVDYFEENGINPALVLDEGGAVVERAFPGLKVPCAYIGIAEKGMIDVEYRVKSNGGHASAPKPGTPVPTLAKACTKVEAKPFKSHITKPVAEMFDTLGRHSNFLYRMIFANMWCFGWVIDLLGKMQGGDINALIRTTVAFTQMSGSSASNVIPPEATMVSNLRLNPEDTMESALEYLKSVVDDERVELTRLRGYNPSRISVTDCEGFDRVASAAVSTWQGCIPTPYLMMQCSDSRHWGKISDRVYRFSAMDLTKEERGSIHGHNERIRIECLERACEFYIRMMKKS
ncbi:MAG: M20/M25/M40 family metallo-hydrolase [Clostridia bacterium]|nr:M20/M25/M40 family metallo-hydrolase [Clostridia bacterium]